MYLVGYDIGSSSIKATLLNAESGEIVASATSPKTEMEILAIRPGWAEQHPNIWWENVIAATREIKTIAKIDISDIKAIGISYQMHGLVIVDKNKEVLRPSIIWCDSRAVAIGDQAFHDIGAAVCLKHLLNSPGNFTASKLKWVKQNEPEIYDRIDKAMLPGDFIAMKMTDEIRTTPSGLSEGIIWDFRKAGLAELVLNHYDISTDLIPTVVQTFSIQGQLTRKAADELGLKPGILVSYRAGDQPNNALSLNVLNPGEVAATAGTSGVIYGVGDKPNFDTKSRVNTFVHVNNTPGSPRYGVLLCINGTGILYNWFKKNMMSSDNSGDIYSKMNQLAAQAPAGADGLIILPFGNGAERVLENKDIGASIHGLNLNIHNRSHVLCAAQEGIVFALNYGLKVMNGMGIEAKTVRAGHANMFLSPLFGSVFSTLTQARVELYNTDGSQGAARGAGIGAGIYRNQHEAFVGLKTIRTIEPDTALIAGYQECYEKWIDCLTSIVN